MQDFAKYRENNTLEASDSEWVLDLPSVLFGILLGAIVVFAAFRVINYRDMRITSDQVVESATEQDPRLEFEFYTELKRDDLYSIVSEWVS